MDITQKITQELGIKSWQVEAVIKLIDEGNTIPFIARYRKEATGALDDEVLRRFEERLKYLRSLEERKQTVIASIESQGKLTDELLAKLEQAETVVAVEDIYRPYKPKRRTRAMIAREKGLEGLAEYIMSSDAAAPVSEEALKYLSEEHEVNDSEAAIKLALDIIAGDISDDADIRTWIRELTARKACSSHRSFLQLRLSSKLVESAVCMKITLSSLRRYLDFLVTEFLLSIEVRTRRCSV